MRVMHIVSGRLFGGGASLNCPELGNPSIDVPLLFLESENGGSENFVGEFRCRHVLVVSIPLSVIFDASPILHLKRDVSQSITCRTT